MQRQELGDPAVGRRPARRCAAARRGSAARATARRRRRSTSAARSSRRRPASTSTGRPPAPEVASISTSASPAPRAARPATITPVEVSLCAQAMTSAARRPRDRARARRRARPSRRSGRRGTARRRVTVANFCENSPKRQVQRRARGRARTRRRPRRRSCRRCRARPRSRRAARTARAGPADAADEALTGLLAVRRAHAARRRGRRARASCSGRTFDGPQPKRPSAGLEVRRGCRGMRLLVGTAPRFKCPRRIEGRSCPGPSARDGLSRADVPVVMSTSSTRTVRSQPTMHRRRTARSRRRPASITAHARAAPLAADALGDRAARVPGAPRCDRR